MSNTHDRPDLDALGKLCDAATCAPGYVVTRDGRVLSTATNWRGYGTRELESIPNSHGYASVRMKVGGRRIRKLVHSLVAVAFLPQRPSAAHQIRHLNGDRTDARADNLAWGTAKENAADRDAHATTARGVRNGAHTKPGSRPVGERNGMRRHPESSSRAKLTWSSVAGIRQRVANGERQTDVARALGLSPHTINQIVRGRSWRVP